MNIVFLIGNILNDIEFNFLYNSKRISIAYTNLKIQDNIITIEGYDETADIMYRCIKKDDIVFIHGKLTQKQNLVVEVIEIKKL